MEIGFIERNKRYISIIIIAANVYLRCIWGVYDNRGILLNLSAEIFAFIFCIYLALSQKEKCKKILLSAPVFWAVSIFLLMKINQICQRGYFFSTQTALMTIGTALLLYFILSNNEGETVEILSGVSELVIIAMFIGGMYWDRWAPGWWRDGEFVRLGLNPGGTVIDSANLYLFMLIPILYVMIIQGRYKRYLPLSILTLIVITLTGSKAPLFAVLMTIAIFVVLRTTNKKKVIYSALGILVFVIVILLLVFQVPLLYGVIGSRIEELILTFSNKDYDLFSSTGQRMAAIAAALEHWYEKPFVGHGFYNFSLQEYSKVEGHIIPDELGGGIYFAEMQIHMNALELLFSFGILGVVLYYWYPVVMIFKSVKGYIRGRRLVNLLAFAFLIAMSVTNLGLDMYYKYITPYFVYTTVYCLLKEAHEE